MGLREEMYEQGKRLFRLRGYLPIFFLPILFLALYESYWLESLIGETADDVYDAFCIAIAVLGLLIRYVTVGSVPKSTSGRNTGRLKGDVLNTTGMYSIVRHPLYFGNCLIFMGLMMHPGVWWLAVMAPMYFILYYERIMFAEEEFLRQRFGDTYCQWSERTPAFWPSLSLWVKPSMSFSLRTAVKREYSTTFGVSTAFAAIDYLEDILGNGILEWEPDTSIPFVAILFLFTIIGILRHKTRLLHISGR